MALKIVLTLTAFLITFIASIAAAQTFDHLQIDNSQCALVSSTSNNKDVVARDERRTEHCSIRIQLQDFNKRYSYCALSGVLATKGRVMCEFGYADHAKSQVFFMSGPDQLCEFVCVRK